MINIAFTDTKSVGDLIDNTEWNNFVSFTQLNSGAAFWASGNYALHSANRTVHYTSGSIKTWFDDLYAPSSSFNSGFASISGGSKIAHGLGVKPNYVNVTPSGVAINFGTTCIVDSTYITVNLTANGTRDVYWFVSK